LKQPSGRVSSGGKYRDREEFFRKIFRGRQTGIVLDCACGAGSSGWPKRGLKKYEFFGDWDGRPYDKSTSMRLICAAKK
jgi:hypothetical protein